jgi:hypothetical protein
MKCKEIDSKIMADRYYMSLKKDRSHRQLLSELRSLWVLDEIWEVKDGNGVVRLFIIVD